MGNSSKVKQLDVLHEQVDVVFEPGMAHVDDEVCWGYFDGTSRTIYISNTDEIRQRQTLLHEYFHACIAVMHGRDEVKGNDNAEEMCVRACELGMTHLLRTKKNKWAVDFIFTDEFTL